MKETASKKRTKALPWVGISTVACLVALIILLWVNFWHYADRDKPWWWVDVFNVGASVATGLLVSFLVYWLVEVLPERRRRRLLKNNLRYIYRDLKRDILGEVVAASVKGGRHDLLLDMDSIDKLMEVKAFREAFDGGHEANEGFYAFENQMDERTPEFEEIILKLKMLSRQIAYTLQSYPFEDAKLFAFFKELEMTLLRLENTEPGYDSSKLLCAFIHQMFTGFSWIDGHRGHDVVEKMIADI